MYVSWRQNGTAWSCGAGISSYWRISSPSASVSAGLVVRRGGNWKTLLIVRISGPSSNEDYVSNAHGSFRLGSSSIGRWTNGFGANSSSFYVSLGRENVSSTYLRKRGDTIIFRSIGGRNGTRIIRPSSRPQSRLFFVGKGKCNNE